MFLWNEGDFGGISRFSYTYEASLKGLPDMPDWLKYRYSNRHKAGENRVLYIKIRVEYDRFLFEVPALLSCERGNSAENKAGKIQNV